VGEVGANIQKHFLQSRPDTTYNQFPLGLS
jgi:hypothetical protein